MARNKNGPMPTEPLVSKAECGHHRVLLNSVSQRLNAPPPRRCFLAPRSTVSLEIGSLQLSLFTLEKIIDSGSKERAMIYGSDV